LAPRRKKKTMSSNIRDFENNIKHTQVLDPVVLTTDTDCDGVDLLGYGSCAFYVMVGESGDTLSGTVYIELEVEESDDDSTYSDCADAVVTNTVSGNNTGTFAKIDAAAEDDAVYMCEYRGSKRYARVVINVSGTHSNGTPIAVLALRGKPTAAPVS
jgi:hypothetical protein